MRDLVDAAELLDRLDGMPVTRAARMAGIDPATLRRWRRTGLASPGLLAAAVTTLDRGDTHPEAPTTSRAPDIHAHATPSADGWILDCYLVGGDDDDIRPVQAVADAAQSGQRHPNAEAAWDHARDLFGGRVTTTTRSAP